MPQRERVSITREADGRLTVEAPPHITVTYTDYAIVAQIEALSSADPMGGRPWEREPRLDYSSLGRDRDMRYYVHLILQEGRVGDEQSI